MRRPNTFRLKIYALIGLHRGEEQRVLAFLGLQLIISIIIGLLSTGIDSMFLEHDLDVYEQNFVSIVEETFEIEPSAAGQGQLSAALLSVSAIILMIGGFWYAGFTDRIDKRKIGLVGVAVFSLVSLVFGLGIIIDKGGVSVPFLYSAMYIFRFLAGIFLLVTFWDTVNLFFDPRESRRLFPLVAIGGSLGYAVGCLLVIPIELLFSTQWVLFFTAALGIVVFISFKRLQNKYIIVTAPRYRNTSGFKEIREGLVQMARNPFLRVVAVSTIIFGLLSGLVMFGYNSIVSELGTKNASVSFIALQRAGVTLLQAFIITRLMSQTGVGKKSLKEGIILQSIVLFLGFVVYAFSMVAIADFTRQVEIALMSPAFLSSLMVIPIRYRGRAMSLNNLVVAPLGMAIASIAVYLLKTRIALSILIYPLVFLLLLRFAFNFIVSKQYLRYIRESFSRKQRIPLENILEQDVFKNKEILQSLMKSASSEDKSLKALIWGKLADKAVKKEDFYFLNTWKPEETDVMYASWLYTAGRLDYQNNIEHIQNGKNSAISEIRLAAREILSQNDAGELKKIREHSKQILSGEESGKYEETEILFRLKDDDFFKWLEKNWSKVSENHHKPLFSILRKHPECFSKKMFEQVLHGKTLEPGLLRKYASMHDVHPDELSAVYDGLSETNSKKEFLHGVSARNDEELDNWMVQKLTSSLNDLISSEQNTWHPSMRRQLVWSGEGNQVLITLSSLILKRNYPHTAQFTDLIEKARKEMIKTICCVYLAYIDSLHLKESRYYPLLEKWFGRDIKELLQQLLLISAFSLKLADHRFAIRAIAKGIGGETIMSIRRHHDEIIGLLDPAVRAIFLSLTEDSSFDERAVNLKRFVRGFYISFKELVSIYEEEVINCSNQVKKELIYHYS